MQGLSQTNSSDSAVGFLVDGDVGHTVNTEVDWVRITRTINN